VAPEKGDLGGREVKEKNVRAYLGEKKPDQTSTWPANPRPHKKSVNAGIEKKRFDPRMGKTKERQYPQPCPAEIKKKNRGFDFTTTGWWFGLTTKKVKCVCD